jgi:hypothetical protein
MRPPSILPILLLAAALSGCAQPSSQDLAAPFGELRDGAVFHYRATGFDVLDNPFDAEVAYAIAALPDALRADGRIVEDAYGWQASATLVGPMSRNEKTPGLHRFAAAWAEPLSFFPDGPRLVSLNPLVFPVKHDWFARLPAPLPVSDTPLLAFEPLLHGYALGESVYVGDLELAFGGTLDRPTLCYRDAGEAFLCVEAEADGAPLPRRVAVRDPRAGGDAWTLERTAWTQGEGAPIPLGAGRAPKHSLPAARAPMEEAAFGPTVAVVPPIGRVPDLNFTPALAEALRSKVLFDGPAPRTYPSDWSFDLAYRLVGPDGRAYDATGTVVGSWRFQFRDGNADEVVFDRMVYEHAAAGTPVMEPATPDTWWQHGALTVPGYTGPDGMEVVPLFDALVHYAPVLDGPAEAVAWLDNAPSNEDGPTWWAIASHCHDDQPPTRLVLDARTGAIRLAFRGVQWNDPIGFDCGDGVMPIR